MRSSIAILFILTASVFAHAAKPAASCTLPFSELGVRTYVAERRGYLTGQIRAARGGETTTFEQEQVVKDYIAFLGTGAVDSATAAELSAWRSAFQRNGVPSSVYEPELAALGDNSRLIRHERRLAVGEKIDHMYVNGEMRNTAITLMKRGKNDEATALFAEQARIASVRIQRLLNASARDYSLLYEAQIRAGQTDEPSQALNATC